MERKRSKRRKGVKGDSGDSDSSPDDDNKYLPYKVENYSRQYVEGGGDYEYLVIYECTKEGEAIGDRDLMALGAVLKRANKGIKRFKRINKYKIGAIFERPGLANSALKNDKTNKELNIHATIPASLTEVTGVINSVPTRMSNKSIYEGISSARNVVTVRRLMRRVREEDGSSHLQPTTTVAITFGCPVLPDHIDIDSWYFPVSVYIPPISQCLKCLRYGHIAKFCKNSQKCSICGEGHFYKDCTKNSKDAICSNCNGNHVAISSECPMKKQKIKENENKYKKLSYSSILDNNQFPSLGSKLNTNITSLLKSDKFLSPLISAIIKLITLNKSENTPITSEAITNILLDTFKDSNNNKPNKSN